MNFMTNFIRRVLAPFTNPPEICSSPRARAPRVLPRRAFTLIEILIVIAIIALLAAILFPVFARAREAAKRTSCASNLKQLALGMTQYSQDYDEKLPIAAPNMNFDHPAMTQRSTACGVATTNCVKWSWHDLIYPYVKSAQVYNDPVGDNRYFDRCLFPTGAACTSSFLTPTPTREKSWIYGGPDQRAIYPSAVPPAVPDKGTRDALAYGYMYQTVAANVNGLPTSTFAFPSEKGLICESFNLQGSTYTFIVPRHFDGVNIAFADGHVKWLKWNVVCRVSATDEDSKHLWFVNGMDNTAG